MANGNHNAVFPSLYFCAKFVKALEFSKEFFHEDLPIEPQSLCFANKYAVFWYDKECETAWDGIGHLSKPSLSNALITEDLHESYLDFSDNRKRVLKLPSNWYEMEELNHFINFPADDFNLSRFMEFRAVRHITLTSVELTTDALDWLILECKFLEVLSLNKCRNLTVVTIPTGSLRSLSIEDCSSLHSISVVSKNLRSFTLSQPCDETNFSIPNGIQELNLDFSDDRVLLPTLPIIVYEFREMIKVKLSGYDLSDLSRWRFRNVGAIRLSEIVLCRVEITSDSLLWLFQNCVSTKSEFEEMQKT